MPTSDAQGARDRDVLQVAEGWILGDHLDDDELRIEPDEVAGWASSVAHAAGWGELTGGPPVFTILFDLPDGDPERDHLAGWHDPQTGVIHLDPRILNRWTVLHEVAHALDYRDAHRPSFRARFCELVGVAFGQDVATAFRVELDEAERAER